MKVLVAPDSFKGSLSAKQVCLVVQRAIRSLDSGITVELLPLADGGEGTLEAVAEALQASIESVDVSGPMGQRVQAQLGFSADKKFAVMEMASASGLTLVPPEHRNPLLATSYGTGELLARALDAGVERILLGIGGSATNDGGAGMLQALGFRLLDAAGKDLPQGAAALRELHHIDRSSVHPRLGRVRIRVACDVVNPLLGPRGATAVYGPQKGATEAMQPLLEQSLAVFADRVEELLQKSFRDRPGAGAAGGMGFGLMSLLQADLGSGFDRIAEAVGLRERLQNGKYDWIITGEGRIDEQSQQGKLLSRLGQLALKMNTPVLAFAGSLGDQTPRLSGIEHIFPIVSRPCNLAEAIADADRLLFEAVQRVMKLLVFCTKRS